MINYDKVSDKIFQIIKGYGHRPIMYNTRGDEVSNPEEARKFFVKEPNYMVSLDEDEDVLRLVRNGSIPLETMEPVMKHIKQLAQSYMLNTYLSSFGQTVSPKEFADEAEKVKGREKNKSDVVESSTHEEEMWQVHIPANIYDGKYYDKRTVPYRVSKDVAATKEEAIEYVNNNKEKVLADLDQKRMRVGDRSIRYVGKPVEKNVFFKDIYHVRPITVGRRMGETVELVGDIAEASISRLHGSKKTSYQTLESVKVIVRHKSAVDEEKHGARSRAIHSIFLERAGERFRFPHNYLPGARAMARHMYEGGELHDTIGSYIIEQTGNYIKLREFYRYARSNKLINEDSEDIVKVVRENIDQIKNTLGKLTGAKSYGRIKEELEEREETVAEELTDESLVDMFTVKKFDEKIGDILPLVNKLVTEKNNWKQKIEEASKEKFTIYREELSEDEIFEFENPLQKLGYNIKRLSERVQEETSLSRFVARVGNKMMEGEELSDFEKAVVRNVLENVEEIDKPKQEDEGLDVIENIVEGFGKKLSKYDDRVLFESSEWVKDSRLFSLSGIHGRHREVFYELLDGMDPSRGFGPEDWVEEMNKFLTKRNAAVRVTNARDADDYIEWKFKKVTPKKKKATTKKKWASSNITSFNPTTFRH